MIIVSSYPPRECGLATFSNDIVNAVARMFGNTLPIEICALQNSETQFKYSSEVTHILSTSLLQEYRRVAEKINERNDIGLVCIQHEFGLFGGTYGDYILAFLLALNKPVVTVFHSVLPKPESDRSVVKIGEDSIIKVDPVVDAVDGRGLIQGRGDIQHAVDHQGCRFQARKARRATASPAVGVVVLERGRCCYVGPPDEAISRSVICLPHSATLRSQ